MAFDPQDARSTIERSYDWVRTENIGADPVFVIVPQRRWTYYTAWFIAVGLAILFLTGGGFILVKKGEKMMQHYIERIYGMDENG